MQSVWIQRFTPGANSPIEPAKRLRFSDFGKIRNVVAQIFIRWNQLLSDTWGDRAKAIVIEPEVDVWMWGAETHLRSTMSWEFAEGIRTWLQAQTFTFGENGKPARPKEALEAAFRRAKVPRSSARYAHVAQRISLANCTDPAFLRLRTALTSWFGAA